VKRARHCPKADNTARPRGPHVAAEHGPGMDAGGPSVASAKTAPMAAATTTTTMAAATAGRNSTRRQNKQRARACEYNSSRHSSLLNDDLLVSWPPERQGAIGRCPEFDTIALWTRARGYYRHRHGKACLRSLRSCHAAQTFHLASARPKLPEYLPLF
jgi:hypothetical protein